MIEISKSSISKFFCDRRTLCGLWLLIGIVSALTKMSATRHNNYDIFRYVFYNTCNGTSLYAPSTDGGFGDLNHYGPFFSVVIAPFALCPTWLGLLLWNIALAMFLYYAVRKLDGKTSTFALLFCAHELLTALFMQQFNVAIAAIIILSYVFVAKEKDWLATLCIVVGTFVKLYGIVGLAFFFFSRHKARYLASLVGWSIVLFCLPMLISSPEYQIEQWQEWFACLAGKNGENVMALAQNISLLGLVRKIGFGISGGNEWWINTFSDLWIIAPALLVQAVAYFRIPQWKSEAFRLNILAAVLMFVVLFSTGSESSGYIIALTGCCIWFTCVPWQRSRWDIALMVFAFVLTSLSPSDLFPRYIKEAWVQPYALKALPVAIIWAKQLYELLTKKYDTAKL